MPDLQKFPKMMYIIPNFLVLHLGENFMKIRTKTAKLQMNENLYTNMNENMLSLKVFHPQLNWAW